MRRVYVYDKATGEVVERVAERRQANGIQAIVKQYGHIARCLPMRAEFHPDGSLKKGIPGARRYDRLGRAVCETRQEVLDLEAANDHRYPWDIE